MNGRNGKLLQAALIVSIFVAIIGVYVFNTNAITHIREVELAQHNELLSKIHQIDLKVTNHCAASDVKMLRVEQDISEIKAQLYEISKLLSQPGK